MNVQKGKKSKVLSIQLFLLVVLLVVTLISAIETKGANSEIKKKTAEAKEALRPANLEVILVSDKACEDCSSLGIYLDYLKSKNVKIVKESRLDVYDIEAQSLISKYKIERIPFFVVTGELNKESELQELWSAWGVILDDVFVLTQSLPPYLDLLTSKVMGLVQVTYITDKGCSDCYDVMAHKGILENGFGVKIINEKTVDISDKEVQELLKKYSINQVPTFIADKEIAVYKGLTSVWGTIGSVESDGTYIFRKPEQMGVYYDIDKKETVKPES